MEPQPRIHDNSRVMLTVHVYYERKVIKGKQRGYEQQGQGEMTKENKGKWKIIENNNNTKGLPLHSPPGFRVRTYQKQAFRANLTNDEPATFCHASQSLTKRSK